MHWGDDIDGVAMKFPEWFYCAM